MPRWFWWVPFWIACACFVVVAAGCIANPDRIRRSWRRTLLHVFNAAGVAVLSYGHATSWSWLPV